MRIVIWHGYLLNGTGSNVYTRALARAWSRQGHDVTVLCQDPHPERFDLGTSTVIRTPLTGPLPVFVLDAYADAQPRLLGDLTEAEREAYVDEQAAAIRALGPADLLLVNHVLLGAPVGAASGLPYIVKAHGSELEFAMRGRPDLCAWADETLAGATAVLAGSEHIVSVLDELVELDRDRLHVVPPGVDTDELRPRERGDALAELVAECNRDEPNAAPGGAGHDQRRPDPGNADRLAGFLASDDPRLVVLYVGKLSREKGVSLLVEAVRGRKVRTVIAGFGPARAELEQQVAAQGSADDVLFTGPLEHRHLARLWALADVSVVPSVFPEAFGMVAAEAAACGSLAVVARHSGLAEIAAGLSAEYPPDLAHLTAFDPGDAEALAQRLDELLALPAERRAELAAAGRRAVQERWSWDGIASTIAGLATASHTG